MTAKRIGESEADKIVARIRDLADPKQMPVRCAGCGKQTTAPSWATRERAYCPACVVEDMRSRGDFLS